MRFRIPRMYRHTFALVDRDPVYRVRVGHMRKFAYRGNRRREGNDERKRKETKENERKRRILKETEIREDAREESSTTSSETESRGTRDKKRAMILGKRRS